MAAVGHIAIGTSNMIELIMTIFLAIALFGCALWISAMDAAVARLDEHKSKPSRLPLVILLLAVGSLGFGVWQFWHRG